MVRLQRIRDINSPEYRFAEKLLIHTFPRDEYRDTDELRRLVAEQDSFNMMAAICDNTPIGFISWWEFPDFHYVEHLATTPQIRGKGAGKAIIDILKQIATNIVLEVEPPTDTLTTRRIRFYQRMGFTLCPQDYIQPPYRKDGNSLPLHLMFYGNLSHESHFHQVEKQIHRTVYNTE